MHGHAEKRTSTRTGRVTWQARLYVDSSNGGPRRETVGSFRLERLALAALKARCDEIRGGAEAESRLTVEQLLARYLAAAELGAKTRERYAGIVDGVLVPEFGDLLASRLRPSAVQEWQTQQLESGRADGHGYAPATVRQHRAVLSGAYEWGRSLGLARENPVRRVKAPRGRTVKQLAPTVAEAVAVVEACRGSIAYLPALLCLSANLRRGEALALRWDAVDTDRGLIVVRASLSQTREDGVFAKSTKSGRERLIPLPPATVAELDAQRERQKNEKTLLGPGYSGEGYVCARSDGSPLRPDSVSHAFDRVAKRRGTAISLHDLRRAYATAMASRQLLDAEGLRDLLGHVDVRTTFGYYVRPVPETQRAAVDAYGEALADARTARSGPQTDRTSALRLIAGGRK